MITTREQRIAQYHKIRGDLATELYPTRHAGMLCEAPPKILHLIYQTPMMVLGTSVDVALTCDGSVGLLVFASGTRHGGGAESGAVAQEEALMRTTSWSDVRVPAKFFNGAAPFYTDYTVKAPGYIFYNDSFEPVEPIPVLFISSAAPNLNVAYPIDKLKSVIMSRLRNILSTAEESNLQHCVVGAYGCGVFKGDPHVYAACWKEAIEEGWYSGKLHFAIPDENLLSIFHEIIPSISEECVVRKDIIK